MGRTVAVTVTLSLSLFTLACSSKDPGADDGQTTTTQGGTESGESSEPSNPSTTDPGETDETEDTDETEEEEGGFVPPDDFLSECSVAPLSVCDEFAQDCSEGEKCTPFAFGDCTFPHCVPITGSKSAGEPCTVDPMSGADDCDANSWCYPGSFDPELPSFCISFCQGTPDDSSCPDSSELCVANDVYDGFIGCRPSCDPLMPAGCEAWERCTISDQQFGCVMGGGVADGEPCGNDQDCDSGACVDAEQLLECAGVGCCAPWCDLMAPNTCAIGLECVPVDVDDPNSNVGVCALP